MGRERDNDGTTTPDIKPKIAFGATQELASGNSAPRVAITEPMARGSNSAADEELELNQRLPVSGEVVDDRYRIVRELGAGGMGRVYEATHTRLGKTIALKIISPETTQNQKLRSQFFREAKLASSFHHPNLISVFDYGDSEEFGPFIAMEYIEGRIMSVYIAEKGLPSTRRSCELILQIAEGLDHIHAQDVVHCDVKPHNIMLSEDPGSRRKLQATILDFGLARTGATKPTKEVHGTPEYLPPEVALQMPLSGAADVYSLGIVLYELLTGTVPFTGTIPEILMGHVAAKVPPMATFCTVEPDPSIVALVARALEKKVEDRHQTMAAFIYELKNAMDMQGFGKKKFRPAKTDAGISPSLRVDSPKEAEPVVSITFEAPQAAASSGREGMLAECFDGLPLPLALLDHDGAVLAANLSFADLLLTETSRLEGSTLTQTRLAQIWPQLEEDLATASCGVVAKRELWIASPDGSTERYEARLEPSLRPKTLSLTLLVV